MADLKVADNPANEIEDGALEALQFAANPADAQSKLTALDSEARQFFEGNARRIINRRLNELNLNK